MDGVGNKVAEVFVGRVNVRVGEVIVVVLEFCGVDKPNVVLTLILGEETEAGRQEEAP